MSKFIDDLIEELRGTVEVAKIFDIEPSAVSNWRRRGAIPPGRLIYLRDAPKHRAAYKRALAMQETSCT